MDAWNMSGYSCAAVTLLLVALIVYYNYSCNIRVEGIVDAWNMSG